MDGDGDGDVGEDIEELFLWFGVELAQGSTNGLSQSLLPCRLSD